MNLYERIVNKEEKISLVGLGYVGMPIAVAFAKKVDVIGFDNNAAKIELYKNGIDPTKEVGNDVIKNTTVQFTSDETMLRQAKFHIVAVPTPVNDDHTPDLNPVESASRIVGRNLTKGSIVVYESTVYPGVTEEICVPILEKESGMKCGVDFKVGYSPERINPGDKVHRPVIRFTVWRPLSKSYPAWTRRPWMWWRRFTNWWWKPVFTVQRASRWQRRQKLLRIPSVISTLRL